MASEKLRQREADRYYESWLNSSVGFDDTPSEQSPRYHQDGSRLRASKDRALTAFAQLGCLRLNLRRGVVTLIGKTTQYILAEATKTLSLISDIGVKDANDELWFGNASLPRTQGISEAALVPQEYVATEDDNTTFAAPALVINDLMKHETYKGRSYAGRIRFYCGVPITTKSGFPIGVYTLTDEQPRNGIDANELRFLCDMAKIIMNHLDIVKNEAARFRGETMILGLGDFVEGASSVSQKTTTTSETHIPSTNSELTEDPKPEKSPTDDFKDMKITAADPQMHRPVAVSRTSYDSGERSSNAKSTHSRNASSSSKPERPVKRTTPEQKIKEETPNNSYKSDDKNSGKLRSKNNLLDESFVEETFSRAANILRQCADADGVLIFDAVSTNLAKRSSTSGFQSEKHRSKRRKSSPREASPTSERSRTNSEVQSDESSSSRSNPSDDSDYRTSKKPVKKLCRLLGFSIDTSDQNLAEMQAPDSIAITERILRSLARSYPQGHVLYCGPDGNIALSDEESSGNPASDSTRTSNASKLADSDLPKSTTRAITEEIARVAPKAQKVIWLPMWDFWKQRWSAGIFVWSRKAERLILGQDDLVYLRTFANSIMMEVARLDAIHSDRAKSTFIANISHELRSPLHGILGNTDILQDTMLDDFQFSLATAIETCGKTLSDTIDHVLDYAKINQLTKQARWRGRIGDGPISPQLNNSSDIEETASTLEESFDLVTIVEEVCETVYTSHTFQSKSQKLNKIRSGSAPIIRQNKPGKLPANVGLVVNVEWQESWWVYTQPGAIRRILMNILGNALKYTDSGMIEVSLSKDQRRSPSDGDSQTNIVLTVADTGRGMSADFVRNHAFTPFAQESQFSPGTGLGLSIVQQIVDSMGGKIEMQSEQKVGTRFSIFLSLLRPSRSELALLSTPPTLQIPQETTGMSLCVLSQVKDFASPAKPYQTAFESTLETTLQSWFGMNITRSGTPDNVLAQFFAYTEPPQFARLLSQHGCSKDLAAIPIVIFTQDTLQAAEVVSKYRDGKGSDTNGLVFEVVSLPIGPQKLSKVFSMLFHRAETSGLGLKRKRGIGLGRSESNSPVPHAADWERKRSVNSPSPTKARPRQANDKYLSSTRSISEAPIPSVDTSSTAQYRVLLVDDNEINLNILKVCMKRGGIEYKTALNGLEACQAFRQAAKTPHTAFTHVLMDISMPVMDGVEATREIRRFEKQREIDSAGGSESETDATSKLGEHRSLVIALSGVASQQVQQDMFDAGADLFYPKPVNMKELIKVITNPLI